MQLIQSTHLLIVVAALCVCCIFNLFVSTRLFNASRDRFVNERVLRPASLAVRIIHAAYTTLMACNPFAALYMLIDRLLCLTPRVAAELHGEIRQCWGFHNHIHASRICKHHEAIRRPHAVPVALSLREAQFIGEILILCSLLLQEHCASLVLAFAIAYSIIKLAYLLRTFFFHAQVQSVGVWDHKRHAVTAFLAIVYFVALFALLYKASHDRASCDLSGVTALYQSAGVAFTFGTTMPVDSVPWIKCIAIAQCFVHLFLVAVFLMHVLDLPSASRPLSSPQPCVHCRREDRKSDRLGSQRSGRRQTAPVFVDSLGELPQVSPQPTPASSRAPEE